MGTLAKIAWHYLLCVPEKGGVWGLLLPKAARAGTGASWPSCHNILALNIAEQQVAPTWAEAALPLEGLHFVSAPLTYGVSLFLVLPLIAFSATPLQHHRLSTDVLLTRSSQPCLSHIKLESVSPTIHLSEMLFASCWEPGGAASF